MERPRASRVSRFVHDGGPEQAPASTASAQVDERLTVVPPVGFETLYRRPVLDGADLPKHPLYLADTPTSRSALVFTRKHANTPIGHDRCTHRRAGDSAATNAPDNPSRLRPAAPPAVEALANLIRRAGWGAPHRPGHIRNEDGREAWLAVEQRRRLFAAPAVRAVTPTRVGSSSTPTTRARAAGLSCPNSRPQTLWQR